MSRVEGPVPTPIRTVFSPNGAPGGARPLLPDADLETTFMMFLGEARKNAANTAESRSNLAKADRDQAADAARKAEDAAKRAETKASFWSEFGSVAKKVAIVAGAIGGAAAVVCSGGTAAPAVIALAGLALSASSPYIGSACGSTAGKVAMWTGLAASVVGGGWSAFATAGAAGSGLATGVKVTAQLVEGAAGGTEGVASAKGERESANVLDHRADAMNATTAMKQADTELASVVEMIKEVEASVRRGLTILHAVTHEREAARNSLAERRMYG